MNLNCLTGKNSNIADTIEGVSMIDKIDVTNKTGAKNIAEKKRKVTRVMLNILNIAPVIGAAVFAVLFSFVLTDRLEERILHSATTFFLWIFASMLYIMVLLHFKELKKMILSALGMIVFIMMAVVVTPLDRYVSLVFDRTHIGSYVIVGIMLVTYLVISILWRKRIEG